MIGRALALLVGVTLVVGMVGKHFSPRVPPGPKKPAVQSARKCPLCESYVLGANPSPCDRPDCPFRPA